MKPKCSLTLRWGNTLICILLNWITHYVKVFMPEPWNNSHFLETRLFIESSDKQEKDIKYKFVWYSPAFWLHTYDSLYVCHADDKEVSKTHGSNIMLFMFQGVLLMSCYLIIFTRVFCLLLDLGGVLKYFTEKMNIPQWK